MDDLRRKVPLTVPAELLRMPEGACKDECFGSMPGCMQGMGYRSARVMPCASVVLGSSFLLLRRPECASAPVKWLWATVRAYNVQCVVDDVGATLLLHEMKDHECLAASSQVAAA